MNGRYIFREIKKEEIPRMFQLILERMKWMDEVGIRQWNVTKYDEVYPLSYYEERRELGEVFVLEDIGTKQIVCVGVLKKEDERWQQDESVTHGGTAFYLHNFATQIGKKGIGTVFLRRAEEYAAQKGIEYFRLDSADDNQKLEQYYERQGYVPVGKCVDGLYTGILREKKL